MASLHERLPAYVAATLVWLALASAYRRVAVIGRAAADRPDRARARFVVAVSLPVAFAAQRAGALAPLCLAACNYAIARALRARPRAATAAAWAFNAAVVFVTVVPMSVVSSLHFLTRRFSDSCDFLSARYNVSYSSRNRSSCGSAPSSCSTFSKSASRTSNWPWSKPRFSNPPSSSPCERLN